MVKNIKIIIIFSFFIVYNLCNECTESIYNCEEIQTSNSNTNCYYNDDYSGCVEMECKDFPLNACTYFKSKDSSRQCIPNPETEKCQLMKCSDLHKDYCQYFSMVDDKYCFQKENDGCELNTCEEAKFGCQVFSPKGNKYCVEKKNHEGCEYKACEELTADTCDLLRFMNYNTNYYYDYDAVCTKNTDSNPKTECITRKCSELTKNCEELILENPGYKCTSNGEGGCHVEKKQCEEIVAYSCSYYSIDENDGKQCVNTLENNGCTLKICEELTSSECNKYSPYDQNQNCIPDGEKCKLVVCEDLPKDECSSFGNFNLEVNCVPYENGCMLLNCYDMPNDQCSNFIPIDPNYKCTNKGGFCTLYPRECEELPIDMCDRYYLNSGNQKCTISKNGTICELEYIEDQDQDQDYAYKLQLSMVYFSLLLVFFIF